jgi:hypothetical protein
MNFLTTREYLAGHCEGTNKARPLETVTQVNVVEEDVDNQRKIC